MPERFVVIMAGGRGERFWPASRLRRPKHLLPIVGEKPMLTQTIVRLGEVVPAGNIFVITNEEQRAAVAETCPMLQPENIIAEPVGRDTAAAVGLALLLVARRDPQGTFAMLPADHVIHDAAAFQKNLRAGFEAAEAEEVLVTIGLQPTEPATGFGYIQRGEAWREFGGQTVYRAKRFVEKPKRAVAEQYLASGDYVWNAGMFVWRAPVVRDAFARFAPELYGQLQTLERRWNEGVSLTAALAEIYPGIVKISVDYALLEKAPHVVVLPASFDWDDVGAWPALARHFPADAQGNVTRGRAMVEQGKGNIVVSDGGHLTAVVGADDLIVVHTADATLVVHKERAQEIKALLKRLETDPGGRALL